MKNTEKQAMIKFIKHTLSTGTLSDIQLEAINKTIKDNNLIID